VQIFVALVWMKVNKVVNKEIEKKSPNFHHFDHWLQNIFLAPLALLMAKSEVKLDIVS